MMLARLIESQTRRLGLEPQERRLLLLMGALVAILLCAYTIAKVLRDALFLVEYGAHALPYAYIGVAIATAVFVWLEHRVSHLVTGLDGGRFTQYLAIGFSIVAATLVPANSRWVIAGFYVWTGSQAMMLLPQFWGLALDVWDSQRARNLFPLLAGCGLIGGLAGGAFAGWLAPLDHRVTLMLWSLPGLLIAAHMLTRAIATHRSHRAHAIEVTSTQSLVAIVRRSPYLQLLSAGIALSVIVGTLVDFQFKAVVQQAHPDPQALMAFLGRFYVVLNALALAFQFGVAGFLMHRLGLGLSAGLEPASVLVFASSMAIGAEWWAVVALRWVQGVLFQTIGKSTTEICYAAVHPRERRRIKTAIDTLVERWSDAVVGVLLIIAMGLLRAPAQTIAIATATLAAAWLVVLVFLMRHYGLAFQQALGSRWLEPAADHESMRLPSSRKALLEGLRADDERRLVIALHLCEHARDANIARAVRACLRHSSRDVRAAAVRTMGEMRLRDSDGAIEASLAENHEGLRRAAVAYFLSWHARPGVFARRLLDGEDPELRHYVLDALFARPSDVPGAMTTDWIDARFQTGTREALILAARAVGVTTGNAPDRRLRELLAHSDPEIQRVALLSAARRPSRDLLDMLAPLLSVPELSHEAGLALAAVGDPAVPTLERLLSAACGGRARILSARTLSRIASPRAVKALTTLVRSSDPGLRHDGLQSLLRVRKTAGVTVLPRSAAHALFLRELREYGTALEPSLRLANNPVPEVRLLGESYNELAQMALERAMEALACWYDPKAILGAFSRLKSRDRARIAPALEYLEHVLPRSMSRRVIEIFEERTAGDASENAVREEELAGWVRTAWHSGDRWLRACAVRASRYVPTLDVGLFADDPIVRVELGALFAEAAPRRAAPPSGSSTRSPEARPC
jgi:ATP:ADP antiporter, AAA family